MGTVNIAWEPTEESIRSHIESCMCPWCGQGPFQVLAGHTFRAHGIDRRALRDAAHLSYSASVCDPEHARGCSERATERDAVKACWGTKPGKKTHRSRVYYESQLAKAIKLPPEQRRLNAAKASARVDRAATRKGGPTNCRVCGKEFYDSPSAHREYCGRACYESTIAARWTPEKDALMHALSAEALKAKRRMRTCAVCGQEFWHPTTNRACCSPECRGESKRRSMVKTIGDWRREHPDEFRQQIGAAQAAMVARRRGTHAAQVDLVCPTCGVEFRRYKHNGKAPTYCSYACYRADQPQKESGDGSN